MADVENELTRTEYLQLLHTAKRLRKERAFFLIKTLCCVGIKIGELSQFTVEMVQAGEGRLISKGTERVVQIPDVIAKELLEYAERHNIHQGILFKTATGEPLDRINCFGIIRDIAEKSGVPVEKCSPKALRMLHIKTQKQIYDDLEYIAKQMYEQLLIGEQLAAEWGEGRKEKGK